MLVDTLSEKIRWRKSAGQRALMTAKLPECIKTRDHPICKYCSVSIHAKPHLLLEVDHIIPVSKGGSLHRGESADAVLACNRTKSKKLA